MEKALLVGLDLQQEQRDFSHSIEELEELSKACELECVGIVTQKAEQIHKALYIGTGKVLEVKDLVQQLEVDIVIFDRPLTPMQLKNLQDKLQVPIMDRTTLILEIFSNRARTSEAKIQVEIAKLQYFLPRLVGLHDALSRQGGTSGAMSSKGAGETKLELDRRHIEKRIALLRSQLGVVERERDTQRKARMRSSTPIVSLIGYTNAGKSTLMNALLKQLTTQEEKLVFEKDMLFATLDTTVRKIERNDGKSFMLTDTVGFIDELPHSLVKAFRSTLEETKYADLLLQVIDCSDPNYKEHMKVTNKTLEELDASHIKMIYVYNKMDKLQEEVIYKDSTNKDKIFISAKDGIHVSELLELIEQKLFGQRKCVQMLIPYANGNVYSALKDCTEIMECEYVEEGTLIKVMVDKELEGRYYNYIKEM